MSSVIAGVGFLVALGVVAPPANAQPPLSGDSVTVSQPAPARTRTSTGYLSKPASPRSAWRLLIIVVAPHASASFLDNPLNLVQVPVEKIDLARRCLNPRASIHPRPHPYISVTVGTDPGVQLPSAIDLTWSMENGAASR